MKRMRVYVSGPMSGYAESNFPEFERVEMNLLLNNQIAISPHRNKPHLCATDYLRSDIIALTQCDAITLLDGWENSIGACVEVAVAISLSLVFVDQYGREVPRPISVTVKDGYDK